MLSRKYEYSIVSPGGGAYQEYLALRHEVFCDELKRVPSSGRRLGGRGFIRLRPGRLHGAQRPEHQTVGPR